MMESIDWKNAINIRRSARSFKMQEIEELKMSLIQRLIGEMQIPFEHHVKIRMFKADANRKLYTVFPSCPNNVAFIANTDNCSISEVGFVGELLILYAASLGISTCWYGHYTLAELERVMPHLGEYSRLSNPKWGYGKNEVEGERAICISPMGYWNTDGIRFFDRMQESIISFKRKPVSALLEGNISEESIPPELLCAFDLARKAPSAANSQHWRFTVSPDFKTIAIAMPIDYKHIKWEHPNVDIGICACHFWLGLMLENVKCKVSLTEEEGRVIWKFEL